MIKALYLGSLQVARASGMDVLNDAIDRLVNEKPQNEWEPVNVAVAPSTITIFDFEVNNAASCPIGPLSSVHVFVRNLSTLFNCV